ncbi:musculin-like [Paramacrobiotus metropolitanus]|uniref:musculin-like n=1 Tax=Paramacrobiotus metropolitanus TaxID=2943436 RepID=UPI002445F7FC|nr:musculin-like [Paramacrobiotus metropolitanus]
MAKKSGVLGKIGGNKRKRGARYTEKPAQRNAANARERARMRILSKAFGRLKTALPWVPPDTKLSKLDTLRLASLYITHLATLLSQDHPSECSTEIPALKMTWPCLAAQAKRMIPDASH